MFLAHVLGAGGGIDFTLATLDQAVQVVHGGSVPCVDYSMQDRRSDFQPGLIPSRLDWPDSFR